jgi:hypothetical protein
MIDKRVWLATGKTLRIKSCLFTNSLDERLGLFLVNRPKNPRDRLARVCRQEGKERVLSQRAFKAWEWKQDLGFALPEGQHLSAPISEHS